MNRVPPQCAPTCSAQPQIYHGSCGRRSQAARLRFCVTVFRFCNVDKTLIGIRSRRLACDWTVPYADVSSPLVTKGGVPVPLFNLVCHDAIMTTYDPGDLHALLNAGLPQIRAGLPIEERLAEIRRMAALPERLAHAELVDHRFFYPNFRRERTSYSDGTKVTVDWDAGAATILPDLHHGGSPAKKPLKMRGIAHARAEAIGTPRPLRIVISGLPC